MPPLSSCSIYWCGHILDTANILLGLVGIRRLLFLIVLLVWQYIPQDPVWMLRVGLWKWVERLNLRCSDNIDKRVFLHKAIFKLIKVGKVMNKYRSLVDIVERVFKEPDRDIVNCFNLSDESIGVFFCHMSMKLSLPPELILLDFTPSSWCKHHHRNWCY